MKGVARTKIDVAQVSGAGCRGLQRESERPFAGRQLQFSNFRHDFNSPIPLKLRGGIPLVNFTLLDMRLFPKFVSLATY